MDLQTKVETGKVAYRLGYHSQVMMLGSCFVENIGEKLDSLRFRVDINPCGIVYNPLSVADTLDILLYGWHFTAADLRQNNGKWVSLHHHGSFSSADQEACLRNINGRLDVSAARLREADLLVITWGTAWAYRCRDNGMIVSNCHKFPASGFERFRLPVAEIVDTYVDLISRLREVNPGLKILFSVSPIRHWKDGAHGNQLSKAVLMLAIDELQRRLEDVDYFPSYEIVMDELRDYRFYVGDMLHLSPLAVDYIWERFREAYIAPEATELMKRIDKINKTLAHRPFEPESGASQSLRRQMMDELEEIGRQIRAAHP